MTRIAVVIGYSLAGACCAKILSRVCDRVIVVERDELPAGPEPRAGVPQSRHAHVILDRGRRELEHFFPGFERTLVARGGLALDPGLEAAGYGRLGWSPRIATDMRQLSASRDLTDAVVRELAAPAANVEIRQRTEIVGIEIEDRRVLGVELRERGGATKKVATSLVVDCSGRSTKLPQLLAQAGVAVPDETVIDSGTWYSTRWFERRAAATAATAAAAPAAHNGATWKSAIVIPTTTKPGALMTPVDGDRWIVSIASVGLGQPQIDEANYQQTLELLPTPIIAETIGAPLSPVYGSRSTPNRLRHYERWEQPLIGFVPVGDAMCSLNPIHGQGVTCAGVCARLLEGTIADVGVGSPQLAPRFIKAQARWLAEPWGHATGFDLRFPTTEGKRPFAPKLLAPYWKLLSDAVRDDLSLLQQLNRIGQLNAPMATMMAPATVAKVLKSAVRRTIKRSSPDAERELAALVAARMAAYPPSALGDAHA